MVTLPRHFAAKPSASRTRRAGRVASQLDDNAETVVSPGMNAMMKGAFKALRWQGPFWKHLPSVFRLANRFGVRQRGLKVHQANMRKVTDVKHYRG